LDTFLRSRFGSCAWTFGTANKIGDRAPYRLEPIQSFTPNKSILNNRVVNLEIYDK